MKARDKEYANRLLKKLRRYVNKYQKSNPKCLIFTAALTDTRILCIIAISIFDKNLAEPSKLRLRTKL